MEMRRFFRGCARALDGDRVRRKYAVSSMVLPAPARLQSLEKHITYSMFPDNERKNVLPMLDALRSVAYRLQALDVARGRAAGASIDWPEPVVSLVRQLRGCMQRLFEHWSRFERCDDVDERAAMHQMTRDLEARLDDATSQDHAGQLSDQALIDLYAMLGCARGLICAVARTQTAVARIDWDEWTEARF
jgi:hypothetical protein